MSDERASERIARALGWPDSPRTGDAFAFMFESGVADLIPEAVLADETQRLANAAERIAALEEERMDWERHDRIEGGLWVRPTTHTPTEGGDAPSTPEPEEDQPHEITLTYKQYFPNRQLLFIELSHANVATYIAWHNTSRIPRPTYTVADGERMATLSNIPAGAVIELIAYNERRMPVSKITRIRTPS